MKILHHAENRKGSLGAAGSILPIKAMFSKKFFLLLLGLISFMAVFLFLSFSSKERWENVVVESFNQQQLSIARSIAGRLEEFFSSAVKYMELYTSINYEEIVQRRNNTLKTMSNFYVIDINLLHNSSEKNIFSTNERRNGLSDREKRYLSLKNIKKAYVSDTYLTNSFPSRKWVVDIVTFNKNDTVVWTIDVIKICQDFTGYVRSGNTGYSWIVNKDAYFLAHIDESFVGENAFLARALKYPAISFTRINMLQKEYFLTGKEGTSWYISGWHRGEQETPIRKLLAYTPAFYAGPQRKSEFWTVAVSAPVEEIKGMVRQAVVYQWVLMVIALGILGFVTGYAFYTRWKWACELEEEVNRKTQRLEQAHHALLRSERLSAVGSAVAHVTHEIKNPLLIIGGFANQLLPSFEKDEKVKKKLLIIVNEVKRLEQFLKEIGQFSTDSIPQKEKIDLNHVVEEVISFVESELVNRRIALDENLSRSPVHILGNSDQLKQVLLNIIKNSIEASPEGGRLTVKVERLTEAVVEITDTGKGISKEILDKVFNPFFTSKKEGTGLGLSISHKIITAHQGTISVQSEGNDKGTTVTVRLPLA